MEAMNYIYKYWDDFGYYVTVDVREISSTLTTPVLGIPVVTITLKNSSAILTLEGDRVAEFRKLYDKYIDEVNGKSS